MPAPINDKTIILAQVGDPDSTLGTILDALWDAYQTVSGGSEDLQRLYAKRGLIEVVMAQTRELTNINLSGNVSDAQSARFDHARAMYEEATKEIERLESLSGISGPAVAGTLFTEELDLPPSPLLPDANADRYAGSPYAARLRRDW